MTKSLSFSNQIDEKQYTMPASDHFYQSWPWVWTDKLNQFQLKHLKRVKFFGFKIEEEDQMLVSLMDLVLKRAMVVKEMSVTEPTATKLSWRVAKIPQSHLNKMKSSSTRSCYNSSNLILFMSNECCFQLTPVYAN